MANPVKQLDEDDQVKIASWFYVMNLLEHYRALTFDDRYQRGLRIMAATHDKEARALKIEVIRQNHNKLIERWEKALGPEWRDQLEQQD